MSRYTGPLLKRGTLSNTSSVFGKKSVNAFLDVSLLNLASCSTGGSARWVFVSSAEAQSPGSGDFDVIVVGGGHAGTEAASAAARMGAKTLLVTHKLDTIGEMSCNPSFGGIGKGHLMKEVDALDGLCGRISDISGVQYKVLNRARGPAVWGYRAQIDRKLYKQHMQNEIFNYKNLTVKAAAVDDLLTDSPNEENLKVCCGIVTSDGTQYRSNSVVLTTGTFLRGELNVGLETRPAGRVGDAASVALAETIERAGFNIGRLRTGTPPRLVKSTINFSNLASWPGDDPPEPFSFMNDRPWIKAKDQIPCHITSTTQECIKIVMDTLHLNRHIQEETRGPRYCPSMEAKALRFGNLNHRIWLEPEGFDSDVIYPNGLSMTMPVEYQMKLLRAIPGLENVDIFRSGYGVKYDFIDPRELKQTLETRKMTNLFFAGQINGTTGYEEAAAQGIIAGINAGAKALGKDSLTVNRTEGYIGVLIDDLTTLGATEPYRMFTARAEYRLTMRPDNADLRLTEKGIAIGCIGQSRQIRYAQMKSQLHRVFELLSSTSMTSPAWKRKLAGDLNLSKPEKKTAFQMLNHPNITVDMILDVIRTDLPEVADLLKQDWLRDRIKIEATYSEVAQELKFEINEIRQDETLRFPDDMTYEGMNLSMEMREKLRNVRPASLAAASRIEGITPDALLRLLRYAKKRSHISADAVNFM